MRKPHKVDVSVDSEIDLTELVVKSSGAIAQNVTAAYIVIRGFKTICAAFEHIVVTKVK